MLLPIFCMDNCQTARMAAHKKLVFVTFNVVFSLNNVIIIQLCSVASALQFKIRSISQIIIYILFVVAYPTVRRIIFWRDII